MEIIKKEIENIIIFETDEERRMMPKILCHIKEKLDIGWGGVKITVQTNSNGTKHIFIRHWEDER